MGWKQGPTAIQVDNSTAVGIAKSIHERDSNWAEKNTIRLQRMLWGPYHNVVHWGHPFEMMRYTKVTL